MKFYQMKKIFFAFFKSLGVLFSLAGIYVVLSIILSLIPISSEEVKEEKIIPIYIYTNGMHTDLVLPVKNTQKDWSKDLPFENIRSQKTDFRYIGIGWGDKGFYLDTPTWAELKVSTAVEAAFWLGDSAMHCTYYREMKEGEDCKKIILTTTQYKRLVNFIQNTFDRDEKGDFIFIKTDAVYGDDDAFYEAKGSYSFIKTCNTWANSALKAAGQKAALWTPLDEGIFWHYR